MSIEEQIASVVSTYEDPIYPVDAVDIFTPQKRVLSVPLDVTGLFYNEAHLAAYVNNTIESLTIEDVPNEEDLKYLQSLQGRAYAGQTLALNTGIGVNAKTSIYVIDYVGDGVSISGSYHCTDQSNSINSSSVIISTNVYHLSISGDNNIYVDIPQESLGTWQMAYFVVDENTPKLPD